jgi:hypothetical protein
MEETGYGDILSDEFLDWRLSMAQKSNGNGNSPPAGEI